MGLDIIDTILDYLWLLKKDFVLRHKKFYSWLCQYYHKDNPIEFLTPKLIRFQFEKEHDGKTIEEYELEFMGIEKESDRDSLLYKHFKETVQTHIELQVERYYLARKEMITQWCEIVDYMWEHPERINPSLLDDYIVEQINLVCRLKRKKNPLLNGIQAKFGKEWWDKQAKCWRPERRHRF